MESWWPGAPRWARAAALVCAAALAYGTLVHVVQLALGGTDPYPGVPSWLAAYFVSLTLLDPLAAVLLLRRRRCGLALACGVLVTDAVANGYANHVLDETAGLTVGRVGHAVITALALASALVAVRLWSVPPAGGAARRRAPGPAGA